MATTNFAIIRFVARGLGLFISVGYLALIIILGANPLAGTVSRLEFIWGFFAPCIYMIGFLIAWKRETIGGIVIAVSCLIYILATFTDLGFFNIIPSTLLAISAVLFIILGSKKKNNPPSTLD